MNINFLNYKLKTNLKTSIKIVQLRTKIKIKRKNIFLTKTLKTSASILKKNLKKNSFFLFRSLIFYNFLFNNYYKKKIKTKIEKAKTSRLNAKSKKFFFRKEKKNLLKKRSKHFNRFKKSTNFFIRKIKKLKKKLFFSKLFFSNFLIKNRIFFNSKIVFQSLFRTEKRKKKIRNFNWRIKYNKILKRKKNRNFFYFLSKTHNSRNLKKKYNKLNFIFQKDYLLNDFSDDAVFSSLFFFFKKQNFNFLIRTKNLFINLKLRYHLFLILQKSNFFLTENNFVFKFKNKNYFKNFFLFYFNKNFKIFSSVFEISITKTVENLKNQQLLLSLKKKSTLINKKFFIFSNFLTFPNISNSFFKEAENSLFIDSFLYNKNLIQKNKKLLKIKIKKKKNFFKTYRLSQKFILPNCFLKQIFKSMFTKSSFRKNFKSFSFFSLKAFDETKLSKNLFFFLKKKKESLVNSRKMKNSTLSQLSIKKTFFIKKVFFNDFLIEKTNKKSLNFFFQLLKMIFFFFLQLRFFLKTITFLFLNLF